MVLQVPFPPMEPVLHPKAFDDDDWAYQVKWDGVRCLSYIRNGKVQLFNRRLNTRTVQYPELQQLAGCCVSGEAILDGEIVTFIEGKPSFPTVLRRDRAVFSGTIASLAARFPVKYLIFDILKVNKHVLTAKPLCQRMDILRNTLKTDATIITVDTFHGSGCALFNSVKEQGLEGIVAKKLDSPYLVGKKSRLWLKIKAVRRQLFAVGGFTARGRRVGSLLLGVYDQERFIYTGRVSGLDAASSRELFCKLEKHVQEKPAFIRLPHNLKNIYWVKPLLTLEVEFLEWTEDLKIRHPRILRFTDEKPEKAQLN